MTKLFLPILFLLLTAVSFAQSPVDGFFKGQGNLQAVAGAGVEVNSEYETVNGPIALSNTQIYTALSGAYGITDRFDASLSIPFVTTNSEAGLQDGRLTLKYGVADVKLQSAALSFQLAASFSTPLTDYNTERSISIGQQATTIELRPIVHYKAESGWFTTAQFMAAQKSDPTPDAIGGNIKVGKAMDRDYFDLWFDLLDSNGEFNYLGDPEPPTFRALSPDHQRIGGTYYRRFSDRIGGYIGVVHTLGGINVRLSSGGSLGVVVDL